MKIDSRTGFVYTEEDVRKIAEDAAAFAIKNFADVNLDKGITQTDYLSETLSVADMARFLRISRPKAYELTRKDGFPALHVGRRIVISKAFLLDWMREEARKE